MIFMIYSEYNLERRQFFKNNVEKIFRVDLFFLKESIMARFKRFVFLLACLVIFPAFGHASSFSLSDFRLWGFQILPESGGTDALFNDGAS